MAMAPEEAATTSTAAPILAPKHPRTSGVFVSPPGAALGDDGIPSGIPVSEDDRPLSWEFLQNTPSDVLAHHFRRSKMSLGMLEAVDLARQAVYESFGAKICIEVLNIPETRSPMGRKDVSIEGIRKASIVPNLYPYLLEKGIGHYCIFATYDVSPESLAAICQNACGEDVEYVLFQHEDNRRRVTGGFLRTFHVFVKSKINPEDVPQLDASEPGPEQRFEAPPIFRQASDDTSTPTTWDELYAASQTEEGIRGIAGTFSRRKSIDTAYKTFRQELAQHFVNTGAKIKTVNLGLPGTIGEDGRVSCTVPQGLKKWTLFLNEFPYDIEPSVKHYVLFATWVLEQAEVDEILARELPNYDLLFYENAPHQKSVPEVWHVQVFVRERVQAE